MNLTRHKKRIHEKLKTEVCHVCGKSYLDKYNLKKHVELAHPDGEQKFVCDKCGASYAALQTLRQGPLKIWTEHFLKIALRGKDPRTLGEDFLDHNLL